MGSIGSVFNNDNVNDKVPPPPPVPPPPGIRSGLPQQLSQLSTGVVASKPKWNYNTSLNPKAVRTRAQVLGEPSYVRGVGGGLEEKFQELCEAYVEQTNNFIKILKNKGYLPSNTKYVDIPESNESLDEMLDNLIVDIGTNPIKEDLEGLPSVKEIMDELSGVVVKNSDELSGKPLSDSSKVALNGNNKIQNLPEILRSLKKDNHRLLEFQQILKKRKKAGPPRKNYKNTLDALLDRF